MTLWEAVKDLQDKLDAVCEQRDEALTKLRVSEENAQKLKPALDHANAMLRQFEIETELQRRLQPDHIREFAIAYAKEELDETDFSDAALARCDDAHDALLNEVDRVWKEQGE